ncbi:MAG: hypothetical protein LBJ10_11365 [Clostridiales bacterium]|nr:hypothetical protein [Clostridiales bacterium]
MLIKDAAYPINPDAPIGNTSRIIATGLNAPDAALALLDFFYSYDGTDYLKNLSQGIIWDVGSDGKRYVKDEAWATFDDVAANPENERWRGYIDLIDFAPISGHELNPKYGDALAYNYWASNVDHQREKNEKDPLWKQWYDTYGAVDLADFVAKSGNSKKISPAVSFLPPPTEELEALFPQVGGVVKSNCYKMVMAKDQAEFDALWEDTKAKADALGLQQILDWSYAEWDKAVATVAKYTE